MKKILLICLVLLSPQVFAQWVDLQCQEKDSLLGFNTFLRIHKDQGHGLDHPMQRYTVYFAANGKADSISRHYAIYADWRTSTILVKDRDREVNGYISRQDLTFKDESNPRSGTLRYECEIANNLGARLNRWRKEVEAQRKAEEEAQKAKNVI